MFESGFGMRKNNKRGQGWQFSLAVLFITIVLYLPGFLIARFFYRDNMVAIAVAPLPSFALYAILGIFFLIALD